MNRFLRTQKTKILAGGHQPVILKGVNLGGWLMMEGYILHAPNRPEQRFRREFAAALGKKALEDFDRSFRKNFITLKDIAGIRRLGFNCVRVPFHYRVVEKAPYVYGAPGLFHLDRLIRWAKKHKIWVILDLHAAPGAQNYDWHSDSAGEAQLWQDNTFQRRTYALWEFLADRYRDEEYLAGYDLLNEAVVGDTKILNRFYRQLIMTIRRVDKNHILFIEGNRWAKDLDCLEEFNDDNYALSIHSYEPLDFVFNYVPHLKYPPRLEGRLWHKETVRRHLLKYKQISRKRGVPIYVGEFGINSRGGLFGEEKWLEDRLSCFKEYGFHWTYWTYKAVKNSLFPDGIYSYVENPPWVNRPGPLTGWDTYSTHWPKRRKEMIQSWHTGQFQANSLILKTLKKYVHYDYQFNQS